MKFEFKWLKLVVSEKLCFDMLKGTVAEMSKVTLVTTRFEIM